MKQGHQSIGYRGATACVAAGISYRQLDYWARTELVVPSVQSASGSGSQRLYSFNDILVLKRPTPDLRWAQIYFILRKRTTLLYSSEGQ